MSEEQKQKLFYGAGKTARFGGFGVATTIVLEGIEQQNLWKIIGGAAVMIACVAWSRMHDKSIKEQP